VLSFFRRLSTYRYPHLLLYERRRACGMAPAARPQISIHLVPNIAGAQQHCSRIRILKTLLHFYVIFQNPKTFWVVARAFSNSAQEQTRRPSLLLSIIIIIIIIIINRFVQRISNFSVTNRSMGRTGGQTDGRTPDRYIDLPCCAYSARN